MAVAVNKRTGLLALILGAATFATTVTDQTGAGSGSMNTGAGGTPGAGIVDISAEQPGPVENRPAAPDKVSATNVDTTSSSGFRYDVNGIPEGFEAWFEPQKIALDVFYGGRYLITTLAEYANGKITLLHPEEVAPSIPGILNPAIFAELLRSPLPGNSDRVCQQTNQPLCGRLAPDTVGLIFDETRMRADFFVHPDLLADVAEADPRYLPDGTKEDITLVQNLNSLYTGDDNGNEQFSLYGRTRAGNNGHYAFADWVSTDRQGLSIDELGYRHDLKDHLVTAGLFQTDTDMLRGMNRDLLLGGSIVRSLMRRTDLDSILSTPIDLFLPVRSRVDIFQDNRLVASGFYEAGNQRIDTARLPAGAYPVQIVVTDANGNINTEEQLFVKSTLLAPPGEPIWFVEAGRVMRRTAEALTPDDVDINLVRAGYRWRQNSWLGYGVASAATEQAALGELSATTLFNWLEAGGDVYASTAGGWGAGLRGVARFGQRNLSVSSRYNRADPLPDATEPQYRLIADDRWLHTVQLSDRVGQRGAWSLSSNYSGGRGVQTTRRSALRYSHYMTLPGSRTLTLGGELSEVNGDGAVMLTAQWRSTGPHWTHSAKLDASASNIPGDTDGLAATLGSRWRDNNLFVDEIDAGISAQIDKEGRGVTADVQHGSEYGRGQLALSHNDRELFSQTQYLAGFDTSVVLGESLTPAWGGGPRSGEAAVIMDIRDAEDAIVDVYADGQRQFSARGGRRVPMTLTPYREYQINLIDSGTNLVNFDTEPQRVVLYPGDAASLSWSIKRINIIVGRLQRIEEFCSEVTGDCYALRLPLANARVEGLEGFIFTDSDGFFQGEIEDGVSEISSRHQGEDCHLDISALPVVQGVIRAPGLICGATATPAPPSE